VTPLSHRYTAGPTGERSEEQGNPDDKKEKKSEKRKEDYKREEDLKKKRDRKHEDKRPGR
jgi:hypothetical protein